MTLLAGHNYPNTYREFVAMFPDNSACGAYLMHLRWPDGFICPVCKTRSTPWNESRGRIACPACHHQTSITAGTIFDKTRTALSRGLVFRRILEQAVITKPVTETDVTHG